MISINTRFNQLNAKLPVFHFWKDEGWTSMIKNSVSIKHEKLNDLVILPF